MDTASIISKEMREISKLISSASLIMAVRAEVQSVLKDGAVVTDGRHCAASEYDVVVRCPSHCAVIARRIRGSIPDVNVVKIADNVLGIKSARRGIL